MKLDKKFARSGLLALSGLLFILLFQNCGSSQFKSALDSASTSSGSGTPNPDGSSPQPAPIPSPTQPQIPAPNPGTGPLFSLSVARSGTGTVMSNLAGINCGNDCSESYASGTSVTLTATPAQGFIFSGWGGACSGTNVTCTLSMTETRNVLVTFESASGNPATIDAVISSMPSNSWKSLASTQMKDVCPAPYDHYLCGAVVSAWSGGAYDNARDRMVIYGGGHGDSYYNNVFTFDLVAMKWYRLTEMGEGADGSNSGAGWNDSRLETCGFYPKGVPNITSDLMKGNYVDPDKCFVEPILSQLDLQQPRSAHTYGGVFVEPLSGRYCSLEATFWPSAQAGSPVVVCFDPVTGLWGRIANHPAGTVARGQTAVDANGHVWSVAGEGAYLAEYNPTNNTWTTYGYNNYDSGGGMDADRKRNQIYILHPESNGSYSLKKMDLNSPASLKVDPNYSVVSTSGDLPVNLGTRPGFVYADALDKFFAWGGGRDLYSYDPATAKWQRLSGTGDDPGVQQQWGTNGRFRYSRTKGVFILVNGTEQNVFIYKP